MYFFRLLSIASLQTMILMLFKGWGDHNLYRYNWLWVGAIAVLIAFFLDKIERENSVKRVSQCNVEINA
jgi:hypothetical protein